MMNLSNITGIRSETVKKKAIREKSVVSCGMSKRMERSIEVDFLYEEKHKEKLRSIKRI